MAKVSGHVPTASAAHKLYDLEQVILGEVRWLDRMFSKFSSGSDGGEVTNTKPGV